MGSSKDAVDEQPSHQASGTTTYYGTFQGQPNYPQPVPPSQAPHYPHDDRSLHSHQSQHHGLHGRIMEGRPILGGEHFQRGEKLPFCNLGFGWLLFLLGFVFVLPWYVGAIIFFCLAHDRRERTGLMACAIAALIFFLVGGSKAGGRW